MVNIVTLSVNIVMSTFLHYNFLVSSEKKQGAL